MKAEQAVRSSPDVSGHSPRLTSTERYIRETHDRPLISAEDETAIARLCQAGDAKACNQLVEGNLRLVVKIAGEYGSFYTQNFGDLVQEGNIGLIQATKKFDPGRGIKFSTYAAWWIRAYILKYILDNARLVKIGTSADQRTAFFNLKKAKAKLAALGFDPEDTAQLAKQLDVPETVVAEVNDRLRAGDFSLSTPMGKDPSQVRAWVETLAAEGKAVDEQVADAELLAMLRQAIAEVREELDARKLKILTERVLASEPKEFKEFAVEFGISAAAVQQQEATLKKWIAEQFLEKLRGYKYLH